MIRAGTVDCQRLVHRRHLVALVGCLSQVAFSNGWTCDEACHGATRCAVALYSGVSWGAVPSSTRSVGCKVEMLTNLLAAAREEGCHCLSLVLMLQ